MVDTCVYAGLAGDTDPGRFISAGLYRSRGGNSPWESIGDAFHPAAQVHAIVTDPARPGRMTIGSQDGIFRSDDYGDHWRRLGAPAPGLAVWSLARHPLDSDILFAGYEPFAIYRSTDDGESWQALPVEVTFPDITCHPASYPKRATGFAIDPHHPEEIYASIEIGGLLRSLDDGRTWQCVTEGLYMVEDAVDLHSVIVSAVRPGTVTVATRIGAFRTTDRGAHWRDLAVPLLRPRGSYCRALATAPDDPETIYLGAGNDFDGDTGALFISRDDGRTWQTADLGVSLKCTVFAVAVDPQKPAHIYCASKYGAVFRSDDRGERWEKNSLPIGAGHVYALAVG